LGTTLAWGLGAGAGACGMKSGDAETTGATGGHQSTATGTTTGTHTGTHSGTTTGTVTGTTTGTATGTSQGEGGSAPIDPPNPDLDAGADAQSSCEGLDPTQPLVLYLSADDSNSMASPGHARELLHEGVAPASYTSIRTYEFLNYYNIAYPAPALEPVAIYPQAEVGVEPGTFDLQIGVRAYDAVHPRRPMTITFALDTSGSMDGPSMERERAVVRAVAKSMAAGDIISIVTWNDAHEVVLSGHQATGPDDPTTLAAADALVSDGSTDLQSGLATAYQLANQYYGLTRLNRVILVSDGGANTGITDEQLIALNSQDADHEGIYLVGVGTGPAGDYNDLLMDTVTDKGRGAYVYVDSEQEATRMFVDRFDETMEIAARAVQIELTLPWYLQMKKFYGEEYSENPAEVEAQHLAPSDAMIFNQVLAACDPALVNGQDVVTVRANWVVPQSYVPLSTAVTMPLDELLSGPKEQLHKGKAIVAYAEALKTGSAADLDAALAAIASADPDGNDPELSEIAALIALYPSL
jgi:Ca-activated chloride channel family protein